MGIERKGKRKQIKERIRNEKYYELNGKERKRKEFKIRI